MLKNNKPNWYEHPTWYSKNLVLYGVKNNSANFLYVLDIKKKTSRRLFDNENLWGGIANVSPDNRIFFSGYSQLNGNFTNPEIYLMEGLDSNPKRLTSSKSENWRPVFSKNENAVYYINNNSGVFQLYKLKLSDVQNPVQITHSNQEHWDPAISSNNSLIAYAVKDSGNFDIWIDRLPKDRHLKKGLYILLRMNGIQGLAPTHNIYFTLEPRLTEIKLGLSV